MENHHLIQNSFGKETQETNLGIQDVDKYVPDIMYDMLTMSQIYKEKDDVTHENNFISDDNHVHEDVEVDIIVANVGVVNNHDDKRKYASKGKKDNAIQDMEKNVNTLCEDVVSDDESISLGCVANSKIYRLFTN